MQEEQEEDEVTGGPYPDPEDGVLEAVVVDDDDGSGDLRRRVGQIDGGRQVLVPFWLLGSGVGRTPVGTRHGRFLRAGQEPEGLWSTYRPQVNGRLTFRDSPVIVV